MVYMPLDEAIEGAKAIGWQVEAVSVIPGTIGYQLKNPDGEYVQFAGSEESCWANAYERGLLTVADNE